MQRKIKLIQVPNILVSNQDNNGINISPKTTYLYVWLKMLLNNYKANTLEIQPRELREHLNWKTNVMLKNHMKILKELSLIKYQDEFDNGTLKANQFLKIEIMEIDTKFTQLTEKSIKEKLLKTKEPEKTIRLCYLIKSYTNKQYGYCWLTYDQIQKWGNIRRENIETMTSELVEAKLLHITKGGTIKDTNGRIRKENNKYQLLLR